MTDKQLRMIEKVLKCMELAKDERAPEGERAAASKMAAKLMEENALDFADLKANKPKDGVFIQFDMDMDKAPVKWEGTLANGIARAFDVKVVQQLSPWKIMYCGTKSDIDISVYFFKYLRRSVGMMSSMKFSRKADQETFAYGMVSTISERMRDLYEKRNEMMESDGRALMVVKQDGLADFVKQQFPRLTTGRAIKLKGSHEAHSAGKEAGRRVNISRPIAGSGTTRASIA